MGTVTAKQLHQETKAVLNQLEKGKPLLITRNGRAIARIEPLNTAEKSSWDEVMQEVWQAQKKVKTADRAQNSVLQERARRRR